MMKNEMKKNNKTVLLAILAVFAMVAAGAAVVMASDDEVSAANANASDPTATEETGAAVTKIAWAATIAATAVPADGSYYLDMSGATANTTLNITADKTVTLYVKPNASYTLTVQATNTGTVDTLTIKLAASISAADKVTYYTGLSAQVTTHAGDDSIVAKYSYSDVTGPVAAEVAITGYTGAAWTYGASVTTTAPAYYSKGATLSATISTNGNAAKVLDVTKATIECGLADHTGKIVFEDLLTATAYDLTVATGHDLQLDNGKNDAKGSITVTAGKIEGQGTLVDNATTSIFNCVASAAIGNANTMAPSMAAADDDYTVAYGTANLKYSKETTEAGELVTTTIRLVNSSADISVHMKESYEAVTEANVALTTAKITTTLEITVAANQITNGQITTAIAGGDGVALTISEAVIPTANKLTLTGTAADLNYDLTIGKDAVVDLTAATGSDKSLTVAGTLTVAAEFTTIDGDLTVSGTFAPAGLTTLGGETTVATGGKFTAAALTTVNGELKVRGEMVVDAETITVTNKNVTVYGSIVAAAGTTTIKMKNTTDSAIKFTAQAGSTLTGIEVVKHADSTGTVTIDLSGATGTVYLKGTISSNATYSQTQAVVVEGDLFVTGNAEITIQGSFDVLEGVDVTITKGKITINNELSDVNILGDILIEQEGFLNIEKAKSVKITSSVDNFGKFYCDTKDASITSGATLVNEDGAYFKAEKLTVASGATVTLSGFTDIAAEANNFLNKGTVILDGTEFANLTVALAPAAAADFTGYITMAATDAVVDVKSFVFKNTVAAASQIVIDDSGIAKGKNDTEGTFNKVALTSKTAAAGVNLNTGLSGIKFVSAAGADSKKVFNRTLSMSGVATIVDVNEPASVAPVATITLDNNAAKKADFRLDEGVALTKGITLDVNNNMTISGIVILTDAQIDADGGDLVISGLVSSNKNTVGYGVKASANVSAISMSVTELTATTYYWTDLEGAIDLIELGGIVENVTITVSGEKNAVAEDVTIPENVRIAGAGTITISPATVTVTVEDGATAVAAVTFNVAGALDVENVKKFTPTIVSDVTVTVGNAAEYTSMNRAMAEAEAGDIITVTNELGVTISTNLTVPAGVTLIVPEGIPAKVTKEKVVITVNGILMSDKIALADGLAFGPEAEANTVVMTVNGLLMTGANSADKIAEYANYYKTSGAYWYVSDAVGDYVYTGSLADAIDSKKDVTVYGKVSETSAVTATKPITLAAFEPAIAALATVLTVNDLTLSSASEDVVLTAANGTVNGKVTIPNANDSAVLNLTKFKGTLTFDDDSKGDISKLVAYTDGNLAVSAGTLTIAGVAIAPAADDVLSVASGAEIIVTTGGTLNFNEDRSASIAGIITAEKGGIVIINSVKVVLAGSIVADYNTTAASAGIVRIQNMVFTSGIIAADEGAQININAPLSVGTIPGTVGAAPTIDGKVVLAPGAYVVAYPGADVSGMEFAVGVEPATTNVVLNGKVIATIIADKANAPAIMGVIHELPLEEIVGLNATEVAALKNVDNFKLWGLTSAIETVGETAAASATADPATIDIRASWDTGMSLYIDNVRVSNNIVEDLAVGTHTVMVKANPGYKLADGSNFSVTFDGKAITGLMVFTITADMHDGVVLSATGNLVVDQPDIPEQEKEDNSMIMILLGVLVVMVVILAIVTVIRMMRS